MIEENTTRRPSDENAREQERFVTTLTILSHPDIRRIGECAWLPELKQGQPVELARLGPGFSHTGGRSRPLNDDYISRKPILLSVDSRGNHALDTRKTSIRLRVDGNLLDGVAHYVPGQIRDGLVLTLSERMCLLLQRVPFSARTETSTTEPGFVCESATMKAVYQNILKVAALEIPVLIRGESGTGKELVAQAIHHHSRRQKRKLVTVNLGAIPPGLAASELFGAQKGSFTGAVASQEGYFRSADGGTLFLDEIGEAPPEIQSMLLRVLETGEVHSLGSQKPVQVDVRLLTATDANLEALSQTEAFKAPLLHRLSSYVIHLPPLRARRDDIMRLFVLFADQFYEESGSHLPRTEGSGETLWLPTNLVETLMNYEWPGNIRQLRNVVHQLIINNSERPVLLDLGCLKEYMRSDLSEQVTPDLQPPDAKLSRKPADIDLNDLFEAMKNNRWEPARAARALGIPRSSIYDLIKKSDRLQSTEDLDEAVIRDALKANHGDVERTAASLEVSVHGLRRRINRLGSG